MPALLIVGRIGVHSDEDMDIGSNTENLLRSAPCNVLVSNRKYVPPIDTQAEYTIAWTEEALRRMEKIPMFARGVAKTAIHRYAIEKGHTIISNTVVDAAVGHILPKGAMDAMRALGGNLDAAGIDRDKMQADDSRSKGPHGIDAQRHDDASRRGKAEDLRRHPGLPRPHDPELLCLRRLRLYRQRRDTRQVPRVRRGREPLQAG